MGVKVFYSSVHKCVEYRRFFEADCNNQITCHNDTHRDRHIPVFFISLLNRRNIHQNQAVIIFNLNTGTFLFIQRCFHIIRIDLITLGNLQNLCCRWVNQRNPASRCCLFRLTGHTVLGFKNTNHFCSLPIWIP